MTGAQHGCSGLCLDTQRSEGVVPYVGQGGAEATEQPGEGAEDEDGAGDESSERGVASIAHRRCWR